MKATGIVRRIDDLGRVVIPKEIRRTMRIREGDPLEIYTDNNGEVIFKKYSPIGELSAFAGQYAEALAKGCDGAVVICDRDHCVSAAGVSKKTVMERRVTPQLEEMMDSRRTFILRPNEVNRFTPLEGVEQEALVASPIIAAGDIAGAVVMLKSEEKKQPNESDIKLCQVAAGFLGRQMED